LQQTSGVVVFHEQVIAIIARMTGVSLATADEKRRSLGSPEGQQSVCDWFFPAATERGYQLSTTTAVWDVLRAFASFGFCKAHAAAFALPTYQSAWLKRHHPAAFFAGVLTHEPGMYPRRLMLDEARKMGVEIAPLDINASSGDYTVEGGAIRIGFRAVNGINTEEIRSIVASQPYIDLSDFYHRSGASAPIIESLILTGALDSLYLHDRENGFTHRDLLLHLADLQKIPAQAIDRAQIALPFAGPQLTPSGLPALTQSERTALELEKLDMDVTRHLLEFYAPFLNSIGAVRSCDLLSLRNESSILIAGVKVALQSPPIRSGNRVLFLSLDDGYGCSDSTFFTDVLAHLDSDGNTYASTLKSASLFLVRGVTRRTGARGISIRATGVWDLKEAYRKWQDREGSVAI
jgi:error-prone DNA polymerase